MKSGKLRHFERVTLSPFREQSEIPLLLPEPNLGTDFSRTAYTRERDFWRTIFSAMDEKFRLCCAFPEETRFVNMAARETNGQVSDQKNEVLSKYAKIPKEESAKVMAKAISTLDLKDINIDKVTGALTLYIVAIINRYLEMYKE